MNDDFEPTGSVSAADLLAQLATGAISAVQAVRDALDRCEALQALNAFITLRRDQALAEARAIDAARATGTQLGSLSGLPIVVKDNIALAGCPFTGGSPAFRKHIAPSDASVVAKLKGAGAIVVGKTNLHELAFGVTSNNLHFGPVRNPADLSRVAGGSSGGTAAALASGTVTIGLGTDTGGSGRIPAAFCGCVGYRPTTGRYPSDGVMLLTTTRDTISLMARSVNDLVLADQVIANTHRTGISMQSTPLRLGLLTPFADAGLTSSVRTAFDTAVGLLQDAGVQIVRVDGSELRRLDAEGGLPLVMAEAYPLWRDRVARTHGTDFAAFADSLGSPDVRAIFRSLVPESGRVPDEVYQGIRAVTLPRLRAAYDGLFKDSGVDAFTFPTVVTTAPLIGEDETVLIENERLPLFSTVIRNVAPGSLAGVPGITLPIPLADGDLPVGIALDGPVGADVTLFGVAASVERILRKVPLKPPLR